MSETADAPGRPQRDRNTARLTEAIANHHSTDKDGNLIKPRTQRLDRPQPPRPTGKRKRTTSNTANVSDEDSPDSDFQAIDSESRDDTDSEQDTMTEIPNDEIADILPAKTVPATKKTATRRATAPTRKKSRVTIEEVEDEDSAQRISARNSPTPLTPVTTMAPATPSRTIPTPPSNISTQSKKRNPIYLFYEKVGCDANGKSIPGDSYYKCYHGNRKVLTITKAMRGNLNGLINHLKHFTNMNRLYEVLKVREQPVTDAEKDIAAGKSSMSAQEAADYLRDIEDASENIKMAFEKQKANAAGPWDQDTFNDLIAKWLVACDQPFDEVEKPEFVDMMKYARHPSSDVHIPGRHSMRRRVVKMGDETGKEIREMFDKLESKVSLSLDAWTSSNQHAFLAIVAHYITNDGELEELLIDFRKLIGEHSGENMAEAVWETMKQYGLINRVIAFVMDNATNNDTMVTAIERLCNERNIPFSAKYACLRCMPHTIHLAALKLLEAIGAISKAERKKASSRSGNYQEEVVVPLDSNADEEAANRDESEANIAYSTARSEEVLTAVGKLRAIVRAVRSSPQRRQTWYKEISMTMNSDDNDVKTPALMLILDVRTRWSSTHQMLRRAIKYRRAIDTFVARHRELRAHELGESDWQSIELIADWLKSFRSATTQMSATKAPMASTTHAIFRGLQDDLKNILRNLPNDTDAKIKSGLIDAHRKLSDYYFKFDQSPFYTWAALLDPRISFKAMRRDYSDDLDLSKHLEQSIQDLKEYYSLHYANKHTTPIQPTAPHVSNAPTTHLQSPHKSFTARYRELEEPSTQDELEEYIRATERPQNFDTCNPVHWWVGRRAQFPNLFWMARDILSIPGSAVAVERVFSGGRDTISLRRASLKADTIKTLMLVKKKLHLARAQGRRVPGFHHN